MNREIESSTKYKTEHRNGYFLHPLKENYLWT